MIQYTNSQNFSQVEKAVFIRFLVISFFILLAFSLYKLTANEISGWFGQSKQEIAIERESLKKDLETVIEINKDNIRQTEIIEEIAEIQITELVAINEVKQVIEHKTQAKRQVFTKKAQDIEQDDSKTDFEKSQEYAQIVIDDLWEGHCSITSCN